MLASRGSSHSDSLYSSTKSFGILDVIPLVLSSEQRRFFTDHVPKKGRPFLLLDIKG